MKKIILGLGTIAVVAAPVASVVACSGPAGGRGSSISRLHNLYGNIVDVQAAKLEGYIYSDLVQRSMYDYSSDNSKTGLIMYYVFWKHKKDVGNIHVKDLTIVLSLDTYYRTEIVGHTGGLDDTPIYGMVKVN